MVKYLVEKKAETNWLARAAQKSCRRAAPKSARRPVRLDGNRFQPGDDQSGRFGRQALSRSTERSAPGIKLKKLYIVYRGEGVASQEQVEKRFTCILFWKLKGEGL